MFWDEDAAPPYSLYRCINCGDTWGNHLGWCCPLDAAIAFAYKKKKDIPEEYLFLVKRIEKSKDIPNWKSWRYTEPGYCVCGISIKDCDYHRE